MRLAPVAVALAATLLLTACDNSDEDIPTNAQTAAATPSPAGAVIFCPVIGNGSIPTAPTPIPSCEPGSDVAEEIGPGVFAKESTAPPLPSGAIAVSPYYEYTFTSSPVGARVALSLFLRYPPDTPVPIASIPPNARISWYTYANGDWIRIENAEPIIGETAQNTFNPLPSNLIILAEAP